MLEVTLTKYRFFIIKWLSHKILNFISTDNKRTFRRLQNECKRKINNEEHLIFNQIYIYVYILSTNYRETGYKQTNNNTFTEKKVSQFDSLDESCYCPQKYPH